MDQGFMFNTPHCMSEATLSKEAISVKLSLTASLSEWFSEIKDIWVAEKEHSLL